MKKLAAFLLTMVMAVTNVAALEGEMGYFGGISPGTKLPTEIALSQDKFALDSKYTLAYKENIYLTGEPIEVSGTIEIRPGEINPENPTGNYKETYIIRASSDDNSSSVSRTVSLTTQYVYSESLGQAIKTSTLSGWTETIVAAGKTYRLDSSKSDFSKSMIEEYTPAVKYYSGDVYYTAVYEDITGGGSDLVSTVNSRIYGYDQAFAKSETQVRTITIDNGTDQFFIQETPTITMNKEMTYSSNEPQAISFAGNYKEVIQGNGVLQYNILVGNDQLSVANSFGTIGVSDNPQLSQLTIPALYQLEGHPAKSDIEKLYSMNIFDMNPLAFSTNQVVTRGEYIKMLVTALRIPMPATEEKKTNSRNQAVEEVIEIFTDITSEEGLYPYILAAYEAGLVTSTTVNPYDYITREEMIVFNVRALGLERLGMGLSGMQTPYMDDNKISNYAKNSIYVASQIGIIPSVNGYLFPDMKVSYADCAAFMNLLMDYLRYDLQKDYNQHMML